MKNLFNGNAKKIKQEMRDAGLEYGISLGRRAPMHRMHVDCIMEIVSAGLKPVIFIGSTNGPDSPLYDPVRNPLTVAQQKEQLCRAMPGLNLNKAFIITMDDETDDKKWLENLMDKIKESDLHNKSAVHFRSKSADNVQVEGAQKPLKQYVQAFADQGLGVWQSYNQDPADDVISASDIRLYDLEKLTEEQRNVIGAPDYMIEIARAARAGNPDKNYLEHYNIPLTMLDLTLERLHLEAGISTASIVRSTFDKNGDVTQALLIKEINAAVKAFHARASNDNDVEKKPLLVIGDSVSAEMTALLKQDPTLRVASASIGKFQSDEPFTELFYGDKEHFEANAKRIKGAKAFVVQSTAEPVSDNLQHLLEMIHTLKHHGAEEVTAIIPFAAFARQDRAFDGRFSSIAGELMVKQLKAAGADKIVTFTMHSDASMQFYRDAFGADFIHLTATDIFAAELRNKFYFTSSQLIVGAPDGADKPKDEGQKRARELSEALTGTFNAQAMFRISKTHTAVSQTEIKSFDGDVMDKDCVVVDDMVDGGSTMINAAKLLKERGARSVTCCFTHGLLTKGTGTALEKMMTAKDGSNHVIDHVIMTDAVPGAVDKLAAFGKQYPELAKKIQIVSLGPAILAEIKKQLTAAPVVKPNIKKPAV